MTSKLRGKASARNIVLGIAYLTLFCTIIAQCSLTIKMHQCTHIQGANPEYCGFYDKDFIDLNAHAPGSSPQTPGWDNVLNFFQGIKNIGNTDDLKKNNNHVNAINGLAIFNLIMVLLLASVQVVIRV